MLSRVPSHDLRPCSDEVVHAGRAFFIVTRLRKLRSDALVGESRSVIFLLKNKHLITYILISHVGYVAFQNSTSLMISK